MFCRHVFGNISGGFRGISRKYPNFAGPRPREISEALQLGETLQAAPTLLTLEGSNVNSSHFKLTSPLKGIIPPPPHPDLRVKKFGGQGVKVLDM